MKALMGIAAGLVLPVVLGLGAGFAGAGLLAPGDADPGPKRVEAVPLDALPQTGAVVPLAPVLTDLAGPGGERVRLEMAVVFAQAPKRDVAEAIHADALAYLRATTPAQIATPSGYLFMRADLARRAGDVSDGAATDVLIRTFLVE